LYETILVVDDEPKIVKQARDYLQRGGFRVIDAPDGKTALVRARGERPDLVVLDLNLPEMDGLDVCRALRRESDVPIIMLTARVDETDRLIGLELGADDYITKPLEGHKAKRGGEPIHLTPSEFNLLAILAQHPGQTFTRAQLLDRLHGVAYDGFDRSVDAHVKNLRRKLEPDPAEPRFVLTVYGVGYKFTDEV
jgi:two-component system alkaline phosphatase synthesis response regulator PhoP